MMQSRLSTVVRREKVDVYLRYVGGEPSASAAAGYSALHLREQEQFIDEALGPAGILIWGRCHDSRNQGADFSGVRCRWCGRYRHKQPGEAVARDELLVEIETDKVVMEVVAPEPGVIEAIIVAAGETIVSEAVLATLVPGDAPSKPDDKPAVSEPDEGPVSADASSENVPSETVPMGPAVRAFSMSTGCPGKYRSDWEGRQIAQEDVLSHTSRQQLPTTAAPAAQPSEIDIEGPTSERVEKRVPMTRMRARIAERRGYSANGHADYI